jgi:hypothetical protein
MKASKVEIGKKYLFRTHKRGSAGRGHNRIPPGWHTKKGILIARWGANVTLQVTETVPIKDESEYTGVLSKTDDANKVLLEGYQSVYQQGGFAWAARFVAGDYKTEEKTKNYTTVVRRLVREVPNPEGELGV